MSIVPGAPRRPVEKRSAAAAFGAADVAAAPAAVVEAPVLAAKRRRRKRSADKEPVDAAADQPTIALVQIVHRNAAVPAEEPTAASASAPVDHQPTEAQLKKQLRMQKQLKADLTESFAGLSTPGQRRQARDAAANALLQEKRKRTEEKEKRRSAESNTSTRTKKQNEGWLPPLDRCNEPLWDKQEASLAKLRKEIASEDVIFGDYYEAHSDRTEELLKQESQLLGIEHDPEMSKKNFWFREFGLDNRSDAAHSSLSCSKLLRPKMTVEHVKSALRFIKIGALCEKCINPFALPQNSLEKFAPRCTCSKSAAPVFKVVERSTENIPEGRTKEEMIEEDWNEMCKVQEKKARRGMKAHLIREIGEGAFKKHYPLFKVALEKRTDEFGRAVYQKQQALHELRRAHNQPPTFLMSWTSKKEGDAYLPNEWILDGKWENSEGAKKILGNKDKKGKEKRVKREVNHLTCFRTCTNNCASGRCCSEKMISPWTVNEHGILMQNNGLGPCGTDGDSIRQPHETDHVQVGVCSKRCKCDLSCPRRFSDRGSQSMKIVFMTHTKGWSVRTVEPMVRGEYILSFSGVISTQSELKANDENLEMVLDIAKSKRGSKKQQLTIATDARSNEFRCINHSCAPNSLIVTTHSRDWGEQMHGTSLFSRRALKAFEEITFDYYRPGERFRFDCQCGSYCCRGIKGDDIEA